MSANKKAPAEFLSADDILAIDALIRKNQKVSFVVDKNGVCVSVKEDKK